MLLTKVKKLFQTKAKIAGGLDSPADEEMSELVYEALIHVATRCIPRELSCDSKADKDEEVLRLLSKGGFIKKPAYPIFDTKIETYDARIHLQIDEDLNYAVINKSVALYSRDLDDVAKFENECTTVINLYKSNYNKVAN